VNHSLTDAPAAGENEDENAENRDRLYDFHKTIERANRLTRLQEKTKE
jgi:hypothetical protein